MTTTTPHRGLRTSLPRLIRYMAKRACRRLPSPSWALIDAMESTAISAALIHMEVWARCSYMTHREVLAGAVSAAWDSIQSAEKIAREEAA